jgi:glyoxylase-like metal-dependent hydrolase (beta-lactamase superfamily II)
MLEREAAPGIHRIEDAYTNWYLVEHDAGLTIVDAGVPTSWSSLHDALRELGRSTDDVDAIVLTHAHFDHIGFAERARTQLGLPVYVHQKDVHLTRHPRAYARERTPMYYVATKPKALPCVLAFLMTRAFWPTPIGEVSTFTDGTLPVAGGPQLVFTPGHTFGHVALYYPDRDAVIAGDAVVTFNPYRGDHGPQIVSRAATADSQQALQSLDALARTGARTVLTGHGEVWRDGAESIAAKARERGPT